MPFDTVVAGCCVGIAGCSPYSRSDLAGLVVSPVFRRNIFCPGKAFEKKDRCAFAAGRECCSQATFSCPGTNTANWFDAYWGSSRTKLSGAALSCALDAVPSAASSDAATNSLCASSTRCDTSVSSGWNESDAYGLWCHNDRRTRNCSLLQYTGTISIRPTSTCHSCPHPTATTLPAAIGSGELNATCSACSMIHRDSSSCESCVENASHSSGSLECFPFAPFIRSKNQIGCCSLKVASFCWLLSIAPSVSSSNKRKEADCFRESEKVLFHSFNWSTRSLVISIFAIILL